MDALDVSYREPRLLGQVFGEDDLRLSKALELRLGDLLRGGQTQEVRQDLAFARYSGLGPAASTGMDSGLPCQILKCWAKVE